MEVAVVELVCLILQRFIVCRNFMSIKLESRGAAADEWFAVQP